jgi:hypothetical protein
MARNFYHGSDARVVAGSANFAALVGASPESFGIPVALAAEYQALDAELQQKYRLAVTPETRTSVVIHAKDDLMRTVQRRASTMAAIATRTLAVTDAQLVSLGLQPRKNRTRRPRPSTIPTLEVLRVIGRRVKIRIHARTAEGTRLAWGAFAAEVYSYVGSEPPTEPGQYTFEALAPRETLEIVFPDDAPSGATAWISAAWISRRGERGRACQPVRVTIIGGAVLPGAA